MEPDDVLDTRRRPTPRRRIATWAAGTLIVAGLVSLLVARSSGGTHAPAPSSPLVALPTPAPTSTPGPIAVDTADGNAEPVVVGDLVYALIGGQLVKDDLATGRSASNVLPAIAGDGDDFRLAVDAPRHRLWLVSLDIPQVSITEIDSRTLRQLARVEVLDQAASAAVLDGKLFVATDHGLLTLPATTVDPLTVTLPSGARDDALDVAADPSRHRILVFAALDRGLRVQARTARGSGASAAAPFGKGALMVVGGYIWAAGYGTHGAVLARLDPRTLRPTGHSALEASLGPGAEFAGGAARHFLVRSGGGGDALWCLDARTGAVVHAWPQLADPVVLGAQGVYQVGAGSPIKADSGSCRG